MGGATEDEQPVDLVQSAQLHLAHWTGLLEPSESLFDQPAAVQADGVAGMPRGSAAEVGAASLLVLRHMRGDVQLACGRDEILGVVSLVRAYGDATLAAFLFVLEHQQRSLTLGIAVGLGRHGGGDQAVAVLHQRVSQIRQVRLLAVALLVQPRVRVGGRFMGIVRAFVAVEVRASAAIVVRSVLGAEALVRGPGLSPHGRTPVRGDPDLDQRAVHGEVIVTHEALRLFVHGGKKLLRHLAVEQPVAVLGEDRASSMPRPTNQRNSRL